MRFSASVCCIVGFLLLAGPRPLEAKPDRATHFFDKASKADVALRADPDRLRFRHNIELVIKRWRIAARVSKARPELHRRAKAGEAAAWALLAHWSGRADDRATARRLADALEAEVTVAEAPAAPAEAEPATTTAPSPKGEAAPKLELVAAATPEDDAPLAANDEPSVLDGEPADPEPAAEADEADPEALAAALREVLAKVAPLLPSPEAADAEPSVEVTALRRSTRAAATPRAHALLAIRKVVVDAGHGGEDDGAVGPTGLREADVNLAIARRLGAELEARLGVEVVYTRTDDSFVSLEARTRFANRHQADLFVSVHANAHRKRRVHGIETYYLNTTTNRYAQRLARRENQGSAGRSPETAGNLVANDDVDADAEPEVGMDDEDLAPLPEGELGQDLRLILADLAMRSATVESRRLAGYVQSSMIRKLRSAEYEDVKDLGVKHALFYVLLGARMPAVLVETGFISHPEESRRLGTEAYQAHVATAIAKGVACFASERLELAERLARPSAVSGTGALAAASP